jgi:hypothetical protein
MLLYAPKASPLLLPTLRLSQTKIWQTIDFVCPIIGAYDDNTLRRK